MTSRVTSSLAPARPLSLRMRDFLSSRRTAAFFTLDARWDRHTAASVAYKTNRRLIRNPRKQSANTGLG